LQTPGRVGLGVDGEGDGLGRVGGGGRRRRRGSCLPQRPARDPRRRQQELLQLLAPPGDDDVGRLRVGDELLQLLAVLAQRLHSVRRKPGRSDAFADNVEQGRVGVCRARLDPRSNAGVASLQAQRGGIHRHVGPGS
jgi:hypothetical protein